jgi:cob(I)alamin adenosyltransferase
MIMALKIYTRTGDEGYTSLLGGTKVPKSHIRIEAYGTVDELNSYIGWVADVFPDDHLLPAFREIQDRLFTIGSILACDPEKEIGFAMPVLLDTDITFLENEIDKMEEILPEMKYFILPGGHPSVSITHVARTVCRRAERCVVNMGEHALPVDQRIIIYLNRLSDYLFVLARYIGHELGVQEIPWRPKKTTP